MSKLTIKQEAFVQAYLKTGNASKAYRQAYSASRMKPETVNREAKALLDNPKIAARVTTIQAAQQKRFEITQDRWLAEYAALAFSDLSTVTEWAPETGVIIRSSRDLPPHIRAAVQSIEQTQHGLKIKLHNKQPALDAIGKHFGWFEKDNRQKGEAEAEALKAAAEIDSRDLARVIVDIFAAARISKEAPAEQEDED